MVVNSLKERICSPRNDRRHLGVPIHCKLTKANVDIKVSKQLDSVYHINAQLK